MDQERLQEEAQRIRGRNLAVKTRNLYKKSATRKFTEWLKVHAPDTISETISGDEIKTDALQVTHIENYIAYIKLQESSPGIGVYNNFRSALNDMYREKTGVGTPAQIEGTLKMLFRGLKRDHAEEKQAGLRPLKEGKEAIPFSLYLYLGQAILKRTSPFMHLYHCLCWNVMCRTSNTADINIKHISGADD